MHRTEMRLTKLCLIAATSATLAAASASSRELHWQALVVEATLASDGTLHVSERQDMVFSGDWNGGERSFRLFPGQRITLDRIVRIDPPTGGERELVRGDLDQVDHWDWTSSNTVRWRSRLPSDPVFQATSLSYRLDYRLSGVLVELGEGRFRLDHDFAFSDRPGVIERLEVRLRLGDGWRSLAGFPEMWTARNLPPGQGFVVPVDLVFEGRGEPARQALPAPASPFERAIAVGVFLSGVLYFLVLFLWREASLGRLVSPPAPAIDPGWLEEHLLSMPPEVVGAAWDRSVGSAEVAAVLARLTAEGKLRSRVEPTGWGPFHRPNLHLELLVDRNALSDYEHALIEALFGDSDRTDTESVRRRYQRTGLDPASKIRHGVEAALKRQRGLESGSPRPDWRPTAGLILAGVVWIFTATALRLGFEAALLFSIAALSLTLLPWTLFLLIPARTGRGRVRFPWVALLLQLVGIGLIAVLLGVVELPGASWIQVAGTVLIALGLVRSAFNQLTSKESRQSLRRRLELVWAREFFSRELRRASPRLEDRWYPYLLALGLAPQVDRWFRRFGGTASGSSIPLAGAGDSGGSSTGGGRWTGGGGAFGGAGASASFAAAAAGMAAGVAAPQSSGGGSGGGGSSGGGGGGGW